MYPYRDGLDAQGTSTRVVTDLFRGHGFLAAAPNEIASWFQAWDT